MIWQDAMRCIHVGSVNVVEYYEDWVVHTPSQEFMVPSIIMQKRYEPFEREVVCNKDNIFLRDRYTCAYCNEQFTNEDRLSLDHIFPKSLGGQITWTNAITSCKPCNNKKGNNVRIRPNFPAYKPSYYDLVAKRREFPITIPEAAWVPYLSWPEDNVIVKPRKNKNNVIRLAA
jgi:5-methylcytosine-specific restriction endonuclease McrA